MRLSFLAFPLFAAGDSGSGGVVEDLFEEDDLTTPTGPIAPAVPDPSAPGPGPALGELGHQVTIPVTSVGGQQPGEPTPTTTPTEPASPEGGALALPGFADLNDFAIQALGVKDGLIQFDDEPGPGTPFKDLSAEDQALVTKQWLATLPTADEKTLLAQVRAQGGIDNFVRQRAGALTQDVAALSDDDVQRQSIQAQYQDFTQEEIEQELAHRKTSPLYARQTNTLRTEIAQQQTALEAKQQQAENQHLADIARGTSNLAGILLQDEHRNEVLNDLLTPDPADPTVSIFVKKFDDPKFLFRMAVLDRYADAVIAQLAKTQPRPAATPGSQPALYPAGGGAGNPKKREVDDPFGD